MQTAVETCGERFHRHLVSKDFLPDYVKIIKTNAVSSTVEEKMLDLLQIWSVGFANNTALSPVVEAHSQLLNEGPPILTTTTTCFVKIA